jgi:hypothetical protein
MLPKAKKKRTRVRFFFTLPGVGEVVTDGSFQPLAASFQRYRAGLDGDGPQFHCARFAINCRQGWGSFLASWLRHRRDSK